MSYLQELLGSAYKEGLSEDEISKAVEKVVKAKEKQAEAETLKIKNAFNKASSDLADYKHQLADHLSEDEKKKKEQEELLQKLQAENDEFKKQSAIAQNKANFITLGCSEELAQQTAEALFDGNLDTVFANLRSARDAFEKDIRAGVMKDTPVPPASAGGTAVTKESIMSIKDSEERQAAIAQHIELFR